MKKKILAENLKRVDMHLMLHNVFNDDFGLYNGKIGVLIAYFHLSHYCCNRLYAKFANELLDEVFANISQSMPIGFANGLLGIGWSIEYLLNNDFVGGNSDDILEDIDKKVMEYNLLKIQDKSLSSGQLGFLYYVNARLNSKKYDRNRRCPFDDDLVNQFRSLSSDVVIPSDKEILLSIAESSNVDFKKSADTWKLGLSQGCAGYLLKHTL